MRFGLLSARRENSSSGGVPCYTPPVAAIAYDPSDALAIAAW